MNQTIHKARKNKTKISPDQPKTTQAASSQLKYAVIDFDEHNQSERDKSLKECNENTN